MMRLRLSDADFIMGVYHYENLKYFSPGRRYPICKIMLDLNQWSTLKNNNWINDSIIDAFMVSRKKYSAAWKNIDFLPMFFTVAVLGVNRRVANSNHEKFNVDYHFEDTVFVPYCIHDHYMLLVLNLDQKPIQKLDPFRRDIDEDDEDVLLFSKWIENCKILYPKSKNNLVNIEWQIVTSSSARLLQHDSFNCGSFIMFYMEGIATSSLEDASFEPNLFKNCVEYFLLKSNLPLTNLCLGCSRDNLPFTFECSKCERKAHEMCSRKTFLNEDTCRLCESIDARPNPDPIPQISLPNIGFPNPKTNCWLNSTLQVLLRSPLFMEITSWGNDYQEPILQYLSQLMKGIQTADEDAIKNTLT